MRAQHDVLTYALYPPTITPLTLTTATRLDNHHRATLARPATPRLRRAITTAFTALRDPSS